MEYKVEKYNTTYEIYIYDRKGTPRSAIVQFCYEGLYLPWDKINVSLPPMSVRGEGGNTFNIHGLRIYDDGSVYACISGGFNSVAVGSFRKAFSTPEEGLAAVMEYIKEIQE